MDFFEAQARAKKRTSRLIVFFGLAVIGTILAAYVAALVGFSQASDRRDRRSRRYSDAPPPASTSQFSLWQPRIFFPVAFGTLAVVGLASLYKWSQYSSGGSAVAESVGARRVDPHTTDLHERRLLNVVEEMAIASGVPVPAVYVLDEEPAINAFAAGLTTSDAVVTVTKGTLEKLTREELQSVIGHEFSHILNGDMRLNLRIAAIVFGILVLGLAGRGILWSLGRRRLGVGGEKNKGGGLAFLFAVGLALLIVGYVGYFFGRLIQAAVSRQREFLADASAVQFTRNPTGLTGALKKIGGYALGSTMLSNQSAAIGHFFFAQAFRSGFTGLWATHPPLAERIRAIDPQFDGTFFEPPEVVDVAHESFVAAGLVAPKQALTRLPPQSSVAAIAAMGVITPDQLADTQQLLNATPSRLRSAAQQPAEVTTLLYGLLLESESATRARQRDIVAARAGTDAIRTLDDIDSALRLVRPEQKLPLVQLALPALRQLPSASLAPFLETLDELVHADGQVSPFEFALQKLLARTLELGRNPGAAVVQIYSFNAVFAEISIVLSALARASVADASFAPQAFAHGAAHLKLIEAKLSYDPASDFSALDRALDKLATASLPIKQRTLLAAAHVVNADGQVLVAEYELLRAIAAALDCPMPPLGSTS